VCVLCGWFLTAIGTVHPILEVLSVIGCGIVVLLLLHSETPDVNQRKLRLTGRQTTQRWITVRAVLLLLLLIWATISTMDYLTRASPVLKRGLRHSNLVSDNKLSSSARVAICLSGGGYRAALYHAGVTRELEKIRIPIQAISSVSGGSIFSSFYIAGGSPDEFLRAVTDKRFNLKRELLSVPNLTRLIFAARIPWTSFDVLPIGEFSRTSVQANLLDSVYLNGLRHRDTGVQGCPELMVCMTDIAATEMLGVTPYGTVKQRIAPAAARTRFANPAAAGIGDPLPPWFSTSEQGGLPAGERLATLVSASGAFPGALNPVHPARTGGRDYVLADGGIGDNLGLTLAVAANHLAQVKKSVESGFSYGGVDLSVPEWKLSRWDVDVFLLSDGSAITPSSVPKSTIGEIGSAIDTMYASTGGTSIVGKTEPLGKSDPEIGVPPIIILTPRMLLFTVDRKSINSDTLAHLYFGTELVLAPTPKGEPPRVLTFTSIQPETLQFIISNMPSDERAHALQLLQECAKSGAYANGAWVRFDRTDGTRERQLYDLVVKEFSRRLRAFIRTSTLDDQVPLEDAHSIFLLGRYLAKLNAPYVTYQLNLRSH
jgi:hypothetical protein